jgi:hypothetical protein
MSADADADVDAGSEADATAGESEGERESEERDPGPPDAATRLARLRTDDRERRIATVAAVVVGLALAWVHWLGLVVGGALVAIPRRRFLTAPLAGLAFGAVVLAAFGAWLALVGALGAALGMGRIALVSVGLGLALPLAGSLVRGVV